MIFQNILPARKKKEDILASRKKKISSAEGGECRFFSLYKYAKEMTLAIQVILSSSFSVIFIIFESPKMG